MADDFAVAWQRNGDTVRRFPASALSGHTLPDDARHFLLEVGLPEEAAPYLSFEPSSLDWLGRNEELGRYIGIGSDGAGNPIVIDQDGAIWWIDHEAPNARTFVNSSPAQLGACLLAYRDLVTQTVAAGGEDAWMDQRISRPTVKALRSLMTFIDERGTAPGTFWRDDLDMLTANMLG